MQRMIVEVFGKGDEATGALQISLETALAELGMAGNVTVYRIEDPAHMVGRGVWRGPGLALDGKVVCRGRVPTVLEVREYLETAARRARC